MATVRPFRAIRPEKGYEEKVISLPYDVMNRQEAAEMAEGNPFSFLHICRSEIDLPEQEDPYDISVYEKARDNIKKYLDEGVFLQEDKPCLYIYRQTMDGRVQTGIVGCVSVDEYQNNTIKKHEFTRVEKEKDRIRHFDICDTDTEPVFLTYRDDKRIRTIVEAFAAGNDPVYDFVSGDGIGHTLWVIDDEATLQSLTSLFSEVPYLYIADGHHRSASACKVGLKRREENPDYSGDEEFNFFMAAVFPDSDLKIFDYNRVVKDLNGCSPQEFIDKIKKAGFEVEDKGEEIYYPEGKHDFSMYLEGRWYRLRAKDEIIPDHVIDSLDVAVLQNNILGPILGIEDPRTDKRIDFVGGIRGLKELKKRADSDMKAAFAVYPVDVDDLLRVADNDMVMPPKSTWFEPKLGSGLFLHSLK
ncbi:MAG TPA: DUF1015 domain-containing protein [Candidatus Copromorpha excrementigallinarum]|uniref:DUF1015 domain-containing protein n=1 Tax=Candidatus Allocopromorpha excrementigallinarum TaxID=2840742 RepID=A0A9D1L7C4_9FIRM|nr:DUF1015 domain-containing protein [Candidatus Copromorpha excrementigallinarum]